MVSSSQEDTAKERYSVGNVVTVSCIKTSIWTVEQCANIIINCHIVLSYDAKCLYSYIKVMP